MSSVSNRVIDESPAASRDPMPTFGWSDRDEINAWYDSQEYPTQADFDADFGMVEVSRSEPITDSRESLNRIDAMIARLIEERDAMQARITHEQAERFVDAVAMALKSA